MNRTSLNVRALSALYLGLAGTLVCLAPAPVVAQQQAQRTAPAAADSGGIQVYPITGASLTGVAGKLKDMYGGRPDVQIAADRAGGQVVVTASSAVQHEVSGWLAAEHLTPTATPAAYSAPTSRELRPDAPQQTVTQAWTLKNLGWKDFETKLTKTWGGRIQSSHDAVGDVATFRFAPTSAGSTSIMVDHRSGTATIASPSTAASSWQRLMALLDARPSTASDRTSIVPLAKADPSTIRRAIDLLQQMAAAPSDINRKQHIGQFVAMLFQAGAAQAGAAQPAAPAVAPPPVTPPAIPGAQPGDQAEVTRAGSASPGSLETLARINNVRIEILDDVVVVTGRREDVDRVIQIIEQIERQSIEFRPEVEIFYLRYVDSTAINEMIQQVYGAAFSRQGQVTIIPLQKPNALMLVGRKETIPPVIELITKLDQPAPAGGDLRVFKLQHMSAIDAERTVRGFFVSRPPTDQTLRTGLGTRVLLIAEFRTNSLIVQASPRDMLEVTKLIEQLDVPDSASTNEVRVFKLRNSIADTLAPVLQEAITGATAGTTAQAAIANAPGGATPARTTPPAINLQFLRIGPDGQELIKSGVLSNMRITADARSNTLIVVGPATAMDLMEALILRLDTLPASEAQIKVFTIRNGDATALAEMLQNLFGTAQAAQQQAAAAGLVTATGAGESAIVPLRFSVDQRTNSIIASGNAGDLNVIYHILVRLDEGDIRRRETKVYRLRNAPAQDVANALTQLLQQQLLLVQTAPELVTPVEQIEQQVIVVPEVVTNSLIVSATERQMTRVNNILETLDKRPPMVVIQVVLAEVTLTDNEAFGVEWGLQDALMFDRGIPPAAGAALAPGYNFNSTPLTLPNQNSTSSLASRNDVASQGLSNFALGRIDPTLGFGGLVLTASSESVSVLLRALERSQRSQIISRPMVQTLDNVPAFVQVGAKVPRITGATNTGLTVTPIINDINVGIIMNVTPRTSPDGTIVMQVYTEKSTVGPDATGIPIAVDANGNAIRSPQIPITTAQTTVSARSGQTIILGGLITKDLEEDTRRIPYLADIPVLGRLFRFDSVSNKRTELLIIMTPYVVQTPDQIEWINARESERMSWCLADIVNIHGPVPFGGGAFGGGGPGSASGVPLIYPDVTPGGLPMPVDSSLMQPTSPFPPYPGAPYPPYGDPPVPIPTSGNPSAPPSNTNLTPQPASGNPSMVPPPPRPGFTPPAPSPPGPQPGGVIIPQPPSLTPPGPPYSATPADGRNPLTPPRIDVVSPPPGTARLPGGPSAFPVTQTSMSAPPQYMQQPNSAYPPPGAVPAQYQEPLPR